MQFLLNEESDVPLASLPDDLQEELTMLLGNMRYIDRETLNQVVTEFSDELESVGLSLLVRRSKRPQLGLAVIMFSLGFYMFSLGFKKFFTGFY